MKLLQFIFLALFGQIIGIAAEPTSSSTNVTYADTLMALYVNHKKNNKSNDIPVIINFLAKNKPEVAHEYNPSKNIDFKNIIHEILAYHTIICDTAHQIQLLGLDMLSHFDMAKLCQIFLDAHERLVEQAGKSKPASTLITASVPSNVGSRKPNMTS